VLQIYLAGPDVFLPDARRVGQRKQEICRGFGFQGLFPLDTDDSVAGDPMRIFQANCSLMRRADVGLFNLTPFRGPSADAGTAFELGFLFGHGKPVFGYTSAALKYRDRVEALAGPLAERDGQPWDRDGYAVENFALSDNLMIVQAIKEAGGCVTVVEEKTEKGVSLAAFQAFVACLKVVESKRIEPA
jgi:nucleoside 2-deoxyribosyltransferase